MSSTLGIPMTELPDTTYVEEELVLARRLAWFLVLAMFTATLWLVRESQRLVLELVDELRRLCRSWTDAHESKRQPRRYALAVSASDPCSCGLLALPRVAASTREGLAMSLSDIRDIAAAIAFLYGDDIADDLNERLSDLSDEDADRLRRLIALRAAQGGDW